MNYSSDITVALTSCGRYRLLKKTVESLGLNIDLSKYRKILTEDSQNKKHLERMLSAQAKGFLRWWEIIFTNWVKQQGALRQLYEKIDTKYVFHCEDDWLFKKVEFNIFEISQELLENNPEIGIVQLRDFSKDGGLDHLSIAKSMELEDLYTKEIVRNMRYNELFSKKKVSIWGIHFNYMRNDDNWDFCRGFSYNPGLRRTDQCRRIMFGYENAVDEWAIGLRFSQLWLHGVNIQDGVVMHIGWSILSTWFASHFKDGLALWIMNVFSGTFIYRKKLLVHFFKALILKTYKYLDNITLARILMDWIAVIRTKRGAKKIPLNILTNKEEIAEMNISPEWFTEVKPLGISGVARLKNAADFLEQAVESHLPFLDEIVLIDNMSTDETRDICQKLLSKYPDKIRFFTYPYAVSPIGTENVNTNSIKSFAYYSNWCSSKAKYKYIMKVDDDNIFSMSMWETIRDYVLTVKPERFCAYWWYNLMERDGTIGICKDDLFSGRWWDHGIYPVSEYTYYTQWAIWEVFHHNLLFKRFNLSFLHLKYLKKSGGFHNCITTKVWQEKRLLVASSDILHLSEISKHGLYTEMIKTINNLFPTYKSWI